MKNLISVILFVCLVIPLIMGCEHTRIEEDVYTITMRDTTYQRFVNNAPGNRDNGVIYPSSRTFRNERMMLQDDSTVTREYPNFIRVGLFESIGLIGTSSENTLGGGLFGIFPDFETWIPGSDGVDGALFSGGIYRFGIVEYRLRWFQDAKNWTIGTNALEIIAPNIRTDNLFASILPIYVRKRFFLRDEIPYITVTPSVGLGWFPSQYVNASVSLDIGSLGGLNLRMYVGMVGGMNHTISPQIKGSPNNDVSISQFIPYAGLGVSVLDFLNLVDETEEEWKYMKHSSWDIGLFQFGLISTGADYSALSADTIDTENFLKGLTFRLANASVAIPFLNNQFYAGTSLLNLMIFGQKEWGAGILPIRVGYWQTLLAENLTIEPFFEYNYYPSSFFHIGNRINLAFSERINISLIMGYASGSSDLGFSSDLSREFGLPGDFSRAYFGLSIGFMDQIFFPEQLRYNQ